MIEKLKTKFKENPLLYYALSIAATWAGVGSLMVGIELVQDYGIIPFLLWAFGNTIACMVFGIFAPMIPKLKEVYNSKAMRFIVGIVCIFQIWVMMNGIHSAIADTFLGEIAGRVITYAAAIFFLILLFKNGVIRNVLTDGFSWVVVYLIAAILCIVALCVRGANISSLSLGSEHLLMGINKCIILIPGPFLYPYFHELLDYNKENSDGTKSVNIRRAFIIGGFMFGVYLVFTFILALASLNPYMEIVKAVLITIVGLSSLSSFQYSVYLTFGRKIGLAANISALAIWPLVIPLGVMGAWSLMGNVRIYVVIASVVVAIAWGLIEKRRLAA